jgi:hypothetical protein
MGEATRGMRIGFRPRRSDAVEAARFEEAEPLGGPPSCEETFLDIAVALTLFLGVAALCSALAVVFRG